jgi:hypothetical protein
MLLAVQVAARAGPLLVAPIVNPAACWHGARVGHRRHAHGIE